MQADAKVWLSETPVDGQYYSHTMEFLADAKPACTAGNAQACALVDAITSTHYDTEHYDRPPASIVDAIKAMAA
jgi:hypothetical protein